MPKSSSDYWIRRARVERVALRCASRLQFMCRYPAEYTHARDFGYEEELADGCGWPGSRSSLHRLQGLEKGGR